MKDPNLSEQLFKALITLESYGAKIIYVDEMGKEIIKLISQNLFSPATDKVIDKDTFAVLVGIQFKELK